MCYIISKTNCNSINFYCSVNCLPVPVKKKWKFLFNHWIPRGFKFPWILICLRVNDTFMNEEWKDLIVLFSRKIDSQRSFLSHGAFRIFVFFRYHDSLIDGSTFYLRFIKTIFMFYSFTVLVRYTVTLLTWYIPAFLYSTVHSVQKTFSLNKKNISNWACKK